MQGIKEKSKGGRPSLKDNIDMEQMKKLYVSGWTDAQVGEFYGVTEHTIMNWKRKDEEFFTSLKDWKSEADLKVEKSLYQRALGFEYDEVTYEKSKTGGLGIKIKDGEVEEIKHTDCYKTKIITKHVVPDVTAQIFWLKNRKPNEWRDKHEVEHSGEIKMTKEELKHRTDRLSEYYQKRSNS